MSSPPAGPAPVATRSHPGTLPTFWKRDTMFFANLMGLFFGNEAQTGALAEMVGEIDSYGGRVLPVLHLIYGGERNLLLLEREPDADLCDYLASDLGLKLPELAVMPHHAYQALALDIARGDHPSAAQILGPAARHPAQWIDGYVTDDTLVAVASHLDKRTVSTPEGSRLGNNKLLLHQHLEAAGLPVLPTEVVEGPAGVAAACQKLRLAGYPSAVVKSSVGASGIGILKVPDTADPGAIDVPTHFFYEGPCMVQGWLAPGTMGTTEVRSPSVQIFVNKQTLHLYDITEQILSDDSVHEGNIAPPPYLGTDHALRDELLRQAEVAGLWLHRQGYRGTASADFLVVLREGKAQPDVYVCEVNARLTGATYPAVLARHFHPGGAWLLRNLRFKDPLPGRSLLSALTCSRHLYRQGAPAGILPVNFNLGPDGLVHKGQFLCIADTPVQCFKLLDLAGFELPVAWETERD